MLHLVQQKYKSSSIPWHSLSSTVLYCSAIGISWCSWIISNLKLASFGTYTFLFFNTNLSSIYHSLFLNTFAPAFFISSTILITWSPFASDFSMISSSINRKIRENIQLKKQERVYGKREHCLYTCLKGIAISNFH